MENAVQTLRPDAKIIHLRTLEIPNNPERSAETHPAIMDIYTLEYIDQLLEEHFK